MYTSPPQILTHSQAELLLSGNCLFLDIGKDKPTVLHYGTNGTVNVLHASGERDSGSWALQTDGSYCINWKDGPKGSCSRILWQPGCIQILTLAGEPRGRVLKIVPGEVPELQ